MIWTTARSGTWTHGTKVTRTVAAELCNFVTLDTAGNFAIPDSMKQEYGEK